MKIYFWDDLLWLEAKCLISRVNIEILVSKQRPQPTDIGTFQTNFILKIDQELMSQTVSRLLTWNSSPGDRLICD